MKQTLIKKLKNFFSHILTLLGLLVLGLILALFFSQRGVQSPTKQGAPVTTPAPAFQAAKETPTPVVAATISPTATSEVIPVIITTFPTPTPAASPSPTPTFEPLSDKSIMGFVFEPPQEIPVTRNSTGQNEIVEWLPNSSEEILLKGPVSLRTVNVKNGTIKEYARVNEPGNIYQPVWLPEENGVAYLSLDLKTNQQNLWVGKGDGQIEKIASDVVPPLIPLDKNNVGVLKRNSDIVILSDTKVSANIQPIPAYLSESKPEQNENVARSPMGDWIVYYNNPEKMLQLIDTTNNKSHLIDFGQNKWVWLARWSPDGRKIALLVTEGMPPVDYSHLYILEWPENKFYQIGTDKFNFVTEMAWAPNSRHLLFLPVIDYRDGVETIGLYITDVVKPSETAPIPIPVEGLIGYKGSLSWAPDGKKILVEYLNKSEYSLYQVDVLPQ
ncbi:MAG: hypothetical protein L6R45_09920 [Anaerolineae bacterium]|nr:hypothetical protein [Anaerolineae bacterium]